MKRKIIKVAMQFLLLGIVFWLVGWKIWLGILIMLWANNINLTFKK